MFAFGNGTDGSGGILFLLEHCVEVLPQARRGWGRRHGIEGVGGLRESGEFALAVRAPREVVTRFPVQGRGGMPVKQLDKGIAGALAVHRRRNGGKVTRGNGGVGGEFLLAARDPGFGVKETEIDIAQFAQRAVRTNLGRAHRAFEDAGDLGERELLIAGKQQHFAIVASEP